MSFACMMAPTATANTIPPRAEWPRLERETCSRCGGSGHYSYCQMYGTRCFRCAGKKETLTKRGAAAMQYLNGLRSRPAKEIKVGDTILMGGITMGGTPYDAWVRVASIEEDVQRSKGMRPDGTFPEEWTETPQLVFRGTRKGTEYCTATGHDRPVRVAVPAAEAYATLLQAVAYQDTLTKTGKPRKR